ncbi:hypothetical protein LI90_4359 (plasmid) [Carbonactinospora thermoautotrophica]|uniref:N-acetylmuramoyl-L-alanine amidase domain-containing protein n=1 Tax=Carbonactinospora thermoautotrophica TaxID=1469144 RepID=A0A132MHT0_9ACTN|nr:N-acetylmuramoyl-L-alanine amidase [Carbonactinospora thermoautotrophica]KWW97387.1 hypothetical protein LI90_4359 [Carbonactinospora thermoautotrophica]
MASLTGLETTLRRWGLRVEVLNGGRGYPGRPGRFDPRGVIWHHTAGSLAGGPTASLQTCIRGRSDVPGPLCQVYVGRDLAVRVVTYGRANHAGAGGPWRDVPRDSGNAYFVGVEVESTGNPATEPWTPQMLDVCRRVMAGILDHIGQPADRLIGHKEWAPGRKPDPHSLDMGRERALVAELLRHGPAAYSTTPTTSTEEDEMPSVKEIWTSAESVQSAGSRDGRLAAGPIIGRTLEAVRDLQAKFAALNASVAEIGRAVAALSQGEKITPDELAARMEAAAEKGARDALSNSVVKVRVEVEDAKEAQQS